MKNTNAKGFDKDHKQSSSSQFKNQDKWKKDVRDGDQYIVPSGPKCFGCQGFGHMKPEYPTYLKTIGKSNALAATLSDTEPEDDSDNEDDRILNAFTATVNPTKGIVKDVVSLSSFLVFVCITCLFCFIILSQSSFMLCFV